MVGPAKPLMQELVSDSEDKTKILEMGDYQNSLGVRVEGTGGGFSHIGGGSESECLDSETHMI